MITDYGKDVIQLEPVSYTHLEYATENFIPEDSRKPFLEVMESIAKLASAGKADNNGNMDYGVGKGTYLGHGSNIVKLSLIHISEM